LRQAQSIYSSDGYFSFDDDPVKAKNKI